MKPDRIGLIGIIAIIALLLSIMSYIVTGREGPQGVPGEPGQVGLIGPQGTAGPPGLSGPQGPKGNVGPQGEEGEEGDRGERGTSGSDNVFTLDRTVSRSSDDVRRQLNGGVAWNTTAAEGAVGSNGPVDNKVGNGFRFRNITILEGAEITVAYLTVRAGHTLSGTGVKSRISAEDVDDAGTFADDAVVFDARWEGRTASRVNWYIDAQWNAETDYDSPSIVSVIQEVVDRSGWDSGNDIVIFWDDFDGRTDGVSNKYRSVHSYDQTHDYCVRLHVEYAD